MNKKSDYNYNFRRHLNGISPSFCMAKWLQVTLHLHSGHNHSCHHPATHQTPLSELAANPSALHNSNFKKRQREKMLNGVRPKECDYCWNIEDIGPDLYSDRIFKSMEFWSLPYISQIRDLPPDANPNPTYLEVSFSTTCSFRCSYCSSNFSSRWSEDIKKFGQYPTYSGIQTMEIFPEEQNPYIKAFWDWWPSLVKDLKVFRITGGEPLLSSNTFKVLESLSQNPQPNLEVCINSNLGVSDIAFAKFITLVKDLTENKKILRFQLFTSCEAWGKKAEYIRDGMNFEKFKKNLELFINQAPEARVGIMATFNALSVSSYTQFLNYIYDLKIAFGDRPEDCIAIDTAYLRNPTYQTVQILPASFQEYVQESINFMKERTSYNGSPHRGFSDQEIIRLERILEWMRAPIDAQKLKKERGDFYKFFSEHDRRRNTDFIATFPELTDFWDLCKQSI